MILLESCLQAGPGWSCSKAVYKQDQDGRARKLSTNLYDIYHCWVCSE